VPYALLRVLFFQLAFVLASGVEIPVEFLSELFALLSVVEEMSMTFRTSNVGWKFSE